MLCEQEAAAAFGADRLLIMRLGVVAGAHDPSGRLTYYPWRVRQGGEVLWPPADTPLQWVDAADLAAFTLTMCRTNASGVYNVVGTQSAGLCTRATWGDVLDACLELNAEEPAAARRADITVAPEAFLEQGVAQWSDLPLWQPAGSALHSCSNAKAVAAGLKLCRPIETLRAALATGAPPGPAYGLSSDSEAELLAALRRDGASAAKL